MTILLSYAIALIACIFLFSGCTKILTHHNFHDALAQILSFHRRVTAVLSYLVPIGEVTAGLLLIAGGKTAAILGAGISFALLGSFIGLSISIVRSGRSNVSCACFGPAWSTTFDTKLIVRNCLMTTLVIYIAGSLTLFQLMPLPIISMRNFIPIVCPAVAVLLVIMLSSILRSNWNRSSRSMNQGLEMKANHSLSKEG